MSGCATANSINKGYGKIKYKDGVNKKEALLIAKKCLIESPVKGKYRIINPSILNNGDTYPHPNHWFISFNNKPFTPDSMFLVVVDKRNGEIVYSEKKYFSTVKGLRWIFELEGKTYPWHKTSDELAKN